MTETIKYPFNNFFREENEKRQIYIHHTGGGNAKGAIDFWNNRLKGKGTRGTCDVIDRDGTIYEAFDSKYWAHHLGQVENFSTRISTSKLHRISIGIEVVSWGQLEFDGEKYWSWTGKEVSASEVVCFEDGFRGEHYFQDFTDAQYNALFERLNFLCDKHNIPKRDYSYGFGHLSELPLLGHSGIFAHSMVTFRKFDCPPFPKLIALLKSFANPESIPIVEAKEPEIVNESNQTDAITPDNIADTP